MICKQICHGSSESSEAYILENFFPPYLEYWKQMPINLILIETFQIKLKSNSIFWVAYNYQLLHGQSKIKPKNLCIWQNDKYDILKSWVK